MRRKKVNGVGVNDSPDYREKKAGGGYRMTKIYNTWTAMLSRCYSENFQSKFPTYRGCSVAEEWHKFSNFQDWMRGQDWQGKDLDKDIIKPGNKVYSPETCCFVSKEVNYLLLNPRKPNCPLPIGVYPILKRFGSRLRIKGACVHIGVYDTPEEASIAYLKTKSKHVAKIADMQTNPLIRRSLLFHAGALLLLAQGCVYRLPCMTCL